MNEAELIAAFQGFIALTNQLFFGYVSLLSGFLVMSYLVADKISSFLASVSVALFSIVSALLLFGIFLSHNNTEHILEFMRTAYSRPSLPLIPDEACHPFHANAATDSTAKLPPQQRA